MSRGRKPKPPEQRVRRNEVDTSHLEPYAGPIDRRLTRLQNKSNFSPETQLYFAVWADSEQAEYFTPTDWLTLQRMARLHEKFIQTGSHFVAAELRQCESLLGATIGDRMRLKLAALKEQRKREKEKQEEPPTIEADLQLYAELNDE